MAKRGRKTKLNDTLKEIIPRIIKRGATINELSEIIAVNPRTLDRWAGSNEELSRAIKECKENANQIVEASLYRRATGYNYLEERSYVFNGEIKKYFVEKHIPPDPTSMIFWLKNRKPNEWRNSPVENNPQEAITVKVKKTFEQFCNDAGYPTPYQKQHEMRSFVIDENEPRLLLGARGYGKTDYAVSMGIAYKLYEEWFDNNIQFSCLIVTKSEERNASILAEINRACEIQGMTFEKSNASCLRVVGLVGKDHSVSTITVGSSAVRGRHPKLIIMDDPVTPEDSSEATRRRVMKLYEELNKLCGNIVLIGQPVHKKDLYGKLRGNIKTLEVAHGEIPELDHDLEAQRLAGVSQESISASYFLKVISEEGTPFDKIKFVDRFEPSEGAAAFIDPSFEGGDYTALTILRGYFDGIMVLGRVYKKAWSSCIDEMTEEMVRCNVKRVCIETNALGDLPVDMLRSKVPNGIGVVGKKSTSNKHSRIVNAGAFSESIHLAKDSDKIYIEQVTEYDSTAKHDDAPDSLASCMEWVGLVRGK